MLFNKLLHLLHLLSIKQLSFAHGGALFNDI